jgi:2-oxopent-4-enoate hydratase
METVTPANTARELLEADRRSSSIPPLTDGRPELSIADAYEIQAHGRELRVQQGERIVGRKVGLTSAAMQDMLDVDQPDFGYLTDTMVVPSGATLPIGRFIAPRVEGEIAFRLAASLEGPDVDAAAVLAATGEVAPALEIIDSRIADWRITIADTIADNASSGAAAIGDFSPLGDLDLAAIEMEMTVTARNGEHEVVRGTGRAVLGHPAEAIAWLVRALHTYAGEGIAAGEIVIPGAMAKASPVAAGSHARASFTALGDVTVAFGDQEAN